MRKLILLVVTTMLGGMFCLADPTIAFWPFGDWGLNDASGHGHTLTAGGGTGVTLGDTAVLNGAHSAFNTLQKLDLSSYSALTVEFWTRFTASDNPSTVMILEQSVNINSHDGAFYVDYNEAENGIIGMWRSNLGSSGADFTPVIDCGDGQWHHIAFVIQSSLPNETCTRLYIDKVHVSTHCNKYGGANVGGGNTPFANDYLYIGSRANSGLKFKGEIDNLRITGAALSPDRFVNQDGTAPQPPLVAYWPFGAYGTADASGNGHDLFAAGEGLSFRDGAAVLDGSKASQFGTRLPLDLRGYTSGLTVEFWTSVPVDAPAGDSHLILEMTGDSAAEGLKGTFYIDIDEGNSKLRAMLKNDKAYHIDENYDANLRDGAWHHVALVFDPIVGTANDRYRLYLDGVKQAQNTNFTAYVEHFGKGHLHIGSRADTKYRFTGAIDDVRLTAAALSPSDFMTSRTTENDPVLGHWTFTRLAPTAPEFGLSGNLVASGCVFSNGVAVLNGSGSLATPTALASEAVAHLTAECWYRSAAAVPVDALFRFGGATIPGTIPAAEGWHHAALVFDADVLSLYLDGVPAPGVIDASFDASALARDAVVSFGTGLTGELDDVRLVAAALAPGSFLRAHTDDSPITVAHWTFKSPLGLQDETGTYPLLVPPGGGMTVYEGAARFKFSRGLHTAIPLELSYYPAFTVECFARKAPDAFPGGNLIEQSPNYNVALGSFVLSASIVDHGLPGAGFRNANGGTYNIREATSTLADGAWHHLALTVDRAGGAIATKFYMDGVEQPYAMGYKSTQDTPFIIQTLYFGAREVASDKSLMENAFYNGDLCEVRVTSGALSPADMLGADALRTPRTIADWDFGAASPLADQSGNGHTLVGTAVVRDGAAFFDGTTGLRTENVLALSPYRQVTVEAIFSLDDPDANSIIFEHSDNYANNAGSLTAYSLGCEPNNSQKGKIDAGMKNFIWRSQPDVVRDGRWHHLVLQVDMDSEADYPEQRCRLMVDGNDCRVGRPAWIPAEILKQTALGDYTFYLGMRAMSSFPLFGRIKHVRISSGLLAPESWLKAVPPEVTADDVVAYWPFGGASSCLADAAGHGYDLADANGVTYSKAEACMDFSTNHATFATTSQIDFRSLTNFTVECFVRTTVTNSVSILGTVATLQASRPGFNFSTTVDYGYCAAGVVVPQRSIPYLSPSTGVYRDYKDFYTSFINGHVNDGQWHHLALVVEGGAGTYGLARWYYDRQLKGESSLKVPFEAVSANLQIGSMPGDTPESRFIGSIDDVRITAKALSPVQFLQHRSRAGGMMLVVR